MPTVKIDGMQIEARPVRPLADGRARVDIQAPDGRQWRLDVDRDGEFEVVVSRLDGKLADVDLPTWMGECTRHVAAMG